MRSIALTLTVILFIAGCNKKTNSDETTSSFDFTNVEINKIDNGIASGTFSGKMTKPGSSESIEITFGSFKNVKIQ